MKRDPYPDFADSPGLRDLIETALEERAERAAIDADRPQIERILRFWRANGCPEMFFRIVR